MAPNLMLRTRCVTALPDLLLSYDYPPLLTLTGMIPSPVSYLLSSSANDFSFTSLVSLGGQSVSRDLIAW